MHLLALTPERTLISANKAPRGTDCYCLECGGVVRRRGGNHRLDHFFHLHPSLDCRQSGKSLAHLHTQLRLLQELPKEEAVMERRFPEINRIADVCWEKERIVFEVQCSYMSAEELYERNQDYSSIGYKTVWILHSARFGKPHASSIEYRLQAHTHYFTDIDSNGIGQIYDLHQPILLGMRQKEHLPLKLPIALTRPAPPVLSAAIKSKAPARCFWQLSFEGDLFHHSEALSKKAPLSFSGLFQSAIRYFKRIAAALFHHYLEKACK